MTALRLADAGEAADLAAFLARLIHYDRAAAVRIQAGVGGLPHVAAPDAGTPAAAPAGVLAVFGRPASFEVLAIRTARLAGGAVSGGASLDVTVSAGQLVDAIDAALAELPGGRTSAAAARGVELTITVPAPVTGPPWAGLLPPRGGWRRVEGLPGLDAMRGAVAASIAEFRSRSEALPQERRTRAELDRIGREIWSRTLGDTGLPLRAVHAAQSLGFLRQPARSEVAASAAPGSIAPTVTVTEPLALLAAGGWLRLRTPYGSIAVRRTGISGLSLIPA